MGMNDSKKICGAHLNAKYLILRVVRYLALKAVPKQLMGRKISQVLNTLES